MQWDDDAGLANDYMYGGTLGLGFGRFLRAGGVYFVGPNIDTDFEELDEFDGIPDREVDLQRYGGQLRINLSTQDLIPYLSAGAGVLRFDPQEADVYKSIYTVVGTGLTFSVANRYNLSLGGELLSYRYDPSELFFDVPPDATVGERTVITPSLHAALAFHIGGRSPTEWTDLDRDIQGQFRRGVSNVRFIAEPFYGRLNFNDALNFPKDQNLYGINAGAQLGPYIGLRGFYWRGSEGTDFGDRFAEGFEEISMYGGELTLLLNPRFSEGIIPYIMLGGGQLDVISGYAEEIPAGTTPPEDRLFASGGAGVELPLSNSIRLMGGVRSLLMSNDDAGDVSEPGQVFGSWMYTAGIKFSLGGDSRRLPEDLGGERPMPEPTPEEAEPQPRADASEETTEQMRQEEPSAREKEMAAHIDSLEQMLQRQQQLMQQQLDSLTQVRAAEEAEAARRPQEMRPQDETAREGRPLRTDTAALRGSNLSDRTIALPIPEVGEVYLRVGDTRDTADGAATEAGAPATTMRQPVIFSVLPGQDSQVAEEITAAEVEEIIRQAVREQLEQQTLADTVPALTEAQVERTVRETVSEVMKENAPSTIQEPALSAAEVRRLQNEIQDLRERLNQQASDISEIRQTAEETRPAAQPPQDTVGQQQPPPVDETEPAAEQIQTTEGRFRTVLGRSLTGAYPFTGLRAGSGSAQFQVGIRGDFRTESFSRLRLLPELSLGFGDGTSFALLANVGYTFAEDFATARLNIPIVPYVGVGAGLASDPDADTEFVGNLMLGADYETNVGTLFSEYSTLDLFDVHRFHIGYRVQL